MQPHRQIPEVGTGGWSGQEVVELPLVLIDLGDLTVVAMSASAVDHVGGDRGVDMGDPRPVDELFQGTDNADHLTTLRAMRDGAVDFYRFHGRLGPSRSPQALTTGWVREIRFPHRHVALLEVAAGDHRHSPLAEHLGHEPQHMAVGKMDSAWVIECVSTNVAAVLGVTPQDVIGRPLLDAVERTVVPPIARPGRDARDAAEASLSSGAGDDMGADKEIRCLATPMAGSTDRLFVLTEPPASPRASVTSRMEILEEHLWRIAAEIEASGILRPIADLPYQARLSRIGSLSARQREVLSRLLHGDRVPTIAAKLGVSQSTVRNHLSAIFDHFGVHSQVELLTVLVTEDAPPR